MLTISVVLILGFFFNCYAQGSSLTLDWWTGTVLGVSIGGLVSYFIATRNLETVMAKIATRVSNDSLKNHKEIEHRENQYDVNMRDIDRHKIECGDKMEKSLNSFSETIKKLEIKQAELAVMVKGLLINVNKISDKLQNIIESSKDK